MIAPFRVERAAFSAATDLADQVEEGRLQPRQFGGRFRSQVEIGPHAVGDRVDRRAATGDAGAVGGLRAGRHRDAAEPGDRVRHGEHRVDQAERAVAVAAGSLEGDAIALRADAADGDVVHVRAVHRDEGADAVLVRALLEQVPHAAQIARPFLADIGDEQQIGAGAHAGGIHRAQPGEQHGERARVVADTGRVEPRSLAPDREVGAGGKHRVEMGSDADQWAVAHCQGAGR